jgi:hypothetical protein
LHRLRESPYDRRSRREQGKIPDYIPTIETDLMVWFTDHAAGVATHGATVGLSAADITQTAADITQAATDDKTVRGKPDRECAASIPANRQSSLSCLTRNWSFPSSRIRIPGTRRTHGQAA